MIYEFRSYEVVAGRMPARHARFQNHTLGFFTRHGIRNEIWWPPPYSPMQCATGR